MITLLEVLGSSAAVPELPLGGTLASQDPVHVRDIDGLGPVKAEITTTAFGNTDGEIFQGASVGKRNILITMGFNPAAPGLDLEDQTVADLRLLVYKYFMPRQRVKLRFTHSVLPVTTIEGVVESVEPDIFAQDPQLVVSVLCPRPHFVEQEATILTGVVDDGAIENVIDYPGSVPTGFTLTVRKDDADAYTGPLTITNDVPVDAGYFKVDPVTVDDTKHFEVVTVQTSRRVRNVILLDNSYANLLPVMTADSNWPMLQPGENLLSIFGDSDAQLPWTLIYYARYGGM